VRNSMLGAVVLLGFFPVSALSETVWSNDHWAVDKRDAQNDEDDYACQLVGKSPSTAFAISVSAEDGSAFLEFPLQEGQRTPPTNEFAISLLFDGGGDEHLHANHIFEFNVTSAPIGNLPKFLENFASSKSFAVAGGSVDRTISLKGSRAATTAFLECLSRSKLPAKRFVNSEVYYGSRVGMAATVVDEIGLDTGLSEIKITHTRENALAFCRDYVLDPSEKCIEQTMADVKFSDRIYGNCQTGEFVDMWDSRFRFEGKNYDPNIMADFRIRSLKDDQILDGSSASGYGTAIGVLKALCPKRAREEGFDHR
jgi:hypothetical protein